MLSVHVHQVPVTRNEVGDFLAKRLRRRLVSTIGSWLCCLDESGTNPRERAMIGEVESWNRAGQSERQRGGELDSFTRVVSEISQT
jgi:hypothetical protein